MILYKPAGYVIVQTRGIQTCMGISDNFNIQRVWTKDVSQINMFNPNL